MSEIHVVGAAIVNNDKVLAVQRSAAMQSPLKWEFAGGKVEKGETHIDALKREMQEELGIEIKVNGFLAAGSSEIGENKIMLHVYECEILHGEPVLKEHVKLEWVDIDELLIYDWAEADIPACKALMKRYGVICDC
ncbi:MAG: (deoxy)nucleoside triphosphate pyrophosphohydrolase [Clostridia bacterium]|nr:(deoxy)nucleoside triphosphate pyrophosphohydrolase [Clostridia bacterium]